MALAALALAVFVLHPILHVDSDEHPKCLLCAVAGNALPADCAAQAAAAPPLTAVGALIPPAIGVPLHAHPAGSVHYRDPPLAAS